MFDVGFGELLLLFVLGLLVLGPERLPRFARTVGGFVRKARQTWNSVRTEIESELETEDLRKSIQEHQKELQDAQRAVREAGEDVRRNLDSKVD